MILTRPGVMQLGYDTQFDVPFVRVRSIKDDDQILTYNYGASYGTNILTYNCKMFMVSNGSLSPDPIAGDYRHFHTPCRHRSPAGKMESQKKQIGHPFNSRALLYAASLSSLNAIRGKRVFLHPSQACKALKSFCLPFAGWGKLRILKALWHDGCQKFGCVLPFLMTTSLTWRSLFLMSQSGEDGRLAESAISHDILGLSSVTR